jgi:hypothetical protein
MLLVLTVNQNGSQPETVEVNPSAPTTTKHVTWSDVVRGSIATTNNHQQQAHSVA